MSTKSAVASFFQSRHPNMAPATGTGPCVRRTDEFRRIEALPRREVYDDLSEAMTEWLKTPNGTMRLRREQAWALAELFVNSGCMAALGVGSGKTALSLLAPTVMNAQRPLLILPASTRDKLLQVDLPLYRQHFRIQDNIQVISYEQLSQVRQADFLERAMPDLVIADECHKLKNRAAACTKRLLRHYDAHPFVFMPMSGSVMKRSLMDFGHILHMAMGENSPVPTRFIELKEWAGALDELTRGQEREVEPGALMRFCRPDETPGEGFGRRLVETPGYTHTSDPRVYASDGAEVSLTIREFVPASGVPKEIEDAFEKMRETHKTPGDEEITSALDFFRHAHELVQGFYYRWVWPNGVVDHEWLETRKAWRSYVRSVLARPVGGHHYDTELQVARAVVAGQLVPPNNEYQKWLDVRNRWRAQWNKKQPDTEAVWISQYMIDAVEAQWAPAGTAGIVWVQHGAVIDAFKARGWQTFGAGENEIQLEDGSRNVVASITAHGTGKNLQMFNRALYLSVPTSGTLWEQSAGRMHRSGQQADEVSLEVALTCAETWAAFDQARRDAMGIAEKNKQNQRLCYADILVADEATVLARHRSGNPLWASRKLT